MTVSRISWALRFTAFRLNSRELGLRFDKSPPYTLIENATFSADDMLLAFDHAEVRFDVVLYPMPGQMVKLRGRTALSGTLQVYPLSVLRTCCCKDAG
ncbi:MAG: hypothetical protein P8185_22310 [Deltaproteobacteria bacterium]